MKNFLLRTFWGLFTAGCFYLLLSPFWEYGEPKRLAVAIILGLFFEIGVSIAKKK